MESKLSTTPNSTYFTLPDAHNQRLSTQGPAKIAGLVFVFVLLAVLGIVADQTRSESSASLRMVTTTSVPQMASKASYSRQASKAMPSKAQAGSAQKRVPVVVAATAPRGASMINNLGTLKLEQQYRNMEDAIVASQESPGPTRSAASMPAWIASVCLLAFGALAYMFRPRYAMMSVDSESPKVTDKVAPPHQAEPGSTRVGWIGTGVMGLSMAKHVLEAGYQLAVCSRTMSKTQPLIDLGATKAETPFEVAAQSDVVVTMLGLPEDVSEVIMGDPTDDPPLAVLQGLKPGAVVVDMTTSDPSLAQSIADEALKHGVYSVDAPVSGGDVGAREAKLTIMAGGDAAAIGAVQPLLDCLGTVRRLGDPGAGQSCKLANQVTVASTMIGLVEGMLYAHRAGLDIETYLAAVGPGAAGSRSMELLANRILKRDMEPGFYVKHFTKDLGIAIEEAKRMGMNLPGLALAQSFYASLQAQEKSDLGIQSLILALEELNGLKLGEPIEVVTPQTNPSPEDEASPQARPSPPSPRHDPHLGRFDSTGTIYSEDFKLRCYEADRNRVSTLEALMNIIQEIAVNHAVGMFGTDREGFATDQIMDEMGLMFVLSKMHVRIEKPPMWSDQIRLDTWFGLQGKVGLRREWLLSDGLGVETFGGATSTWLLANTKTRRLARVPPELRERYVNRMPKPFCDGTAEDTEKLPSRQGNEMEDLQPSCEGLKVGRTDIDMNQHVNNVAYVRWVLDAVPATLWGAHTVTAITLEYRAEALFGDTINSYAINSKEMQDRAVDGVAQEGEEIIYHWLANAEDKELLRAKTFWKPK